MFNINVKIKKLNDKTKIPTRGSSSAAGYDIYANIDEPIIIEPGKNVKIPTGFATEMPEDTFGAIFPRSGLATKKGLRLSNSVAVIDADYRGEWIISIYNDSNEIQTIEPGERIAQLILMNYLPISFEEVENLNNTDRGSGGFGSTGMK